MQKMTGEDGYFHAREELINDDSGRAEMHKARLVRSGFMLSGAELVALAGGERSTSNMQRAAVTGNGRVSCGVLSPS